MTSEELEIQARGRYKSDRKNKKWFGHVQLASGAWITVEGEFQGATKNIVFKGKYISEEPVAQRIIQIAEDKHPFAFLECNIVTVVIISDFYTPLLTVEQRDAIRESTLGVPMHSKELNWSNLEPILLYGQELVK